MVTAWSRRIFDPRVLPVALVLAYLPGQSLASASRLWVLTAVMPLGATALWSGRRPRTFKPLVPWLLLVAWILAWVVVAPYPGEVLDVALRLVGTLCAASIGLAASEGDEAHAAELGWLSGTAAATLCAFGGVFVLGESGSFGNVDLLASFAAIGGVCSVALASASIERRAWLGLTVGSLAAIAGGLMVVRSGSLGGLAALCVGVALVGVLDIWGLSRTGPSLDSRAGLESTGHENSAEGVDATGLRRRRVIRGLLAVAMTAGSLAAMVAVVDHRELDSHLAGRDYLASVSLEASAEAPLIGHGPGSFGRAFSEAQLRVGSERWENPLHAHNEVLHAAVELGWPGAILLFLPLVWGALRAAASSGHSTQASGAAAAIATFGVLSLVIFPFYEPASAGLTGLALGYALRPGRRRVNPGSERHRTIPSLPLRLVVWALAAACVLAATMNLVADRLLARGVEKGRLASLELATELALRPARPESYYADGLRDISPATGADIATRAARRSPSPRAWARVGHLAHRAGETERAIEAYEESVRLHARFFAGHYNLSLLYEETGRRRLAIRHGERAASIDPHDERLRLIVH